MLAVLGVRDDTGGRIQPFLSFLYTANIAWIIDRSTDCLQMRSAGDLQVFQRKI